MAAALEMAELEVVLHSALRKARRRIIPLLAVCYFAAYMDRVNISFAAESMNRDLHFSAKIYGLGAGLFFLSYALCEIPSNRLLLRFGARRWIARIMLTWGLLAGAMVFVHSVKSFYGMRLLLGVAEAGFFPGAIYYLSQWFPARERARATGLFYIAFPLSNVVMGPLAGQLLKLGGRLGMSGWQWLFLVEALPAIVMSAVVWFALPDGPASASWLSAEECCAIEAELDKEPARQHAAAHGEGMRQALRSRYVWLFGAFYFCALGSYYAMIFSLPTLLHETTGWSTQNVGALIACFGAIGGLAMIWGAVHSDRSGERRWHIALPMLTMAAGILGAGLFGNRWLVVASLLLATTSYYAAQGPMLSAPMLVFAGEAAAIGFAAINMCGISGGFVGPYWMGWIHDTAGGYAWGLRLLVLPGILAAFLMLRLLRPNERHI